MKSYKELTAWQQARALVKKAYNVTNNFPVDEKFSLTSQIRRAAISVPANIAEGTGRNTSKDTIQFLHISRGSLYELETLIILSNDMDFINASESNIFLEEINSCCRILNGLISHYERK